MPDGLYRFDPITFQLKDSGAAMRKKENKTKVNIELTGKRTSISIVTQQTYGNILYKVKLYTLT